MEAFSHSLGLEARAGAECDSSWGPRSPAHVWLGEVGPPGSATGSVLFESPHGVRLPGLKCCLLVLSHCVALDRSLNLSEPHWSHVCNETTVLGLCEPKRTCCTHTSQMLWLATAFSMWFCCCEGPGGGSQSTPLLPGWSHLHSDHQDLDHL